ncbi:MAG: helix-turn-helix domain-containing protein, partial [Thermoactinospora sp.]|nr:helix-turn-helix domain-containing protein [Thermoactinospora sp.]
AFAAGSGSPPPAPSLAVVPTADRTSWDAVAARLRSAVAVLSDPSLAAGLSGRLTGAAALRGGLEEAGHARGLAESRSGGVVTSDEIYTHALLLATLPGDVRRSFTGHLLGPLIAYDAAHQSELVRTLEVFLDSAGSWQVCGERMHVHVNTVRYRIRRVEELTGRDLSSMADRVDLYLALRAR